MNDDPGYCTTHSQAVLATLTASAKAVNKVLDTEESVLLVTESQLMAILAMHGIDDPDKTTKDIV
jgi:hypothetical protein